MKPKWTFGLILDRVIVGGLGLLIVAVVAMLVVSVRRQSGLDDGLQSSIEDLQDTTTQLKEAVEQLRSTAGDPEVLTDLDDIDEQLQQVDEQLEYLEGNIDEPVFGESLSNTGSSGVVSDPNDTEAQRNLHSVLTTFAWSVGILSIVTAVALAFVLRKRHSRRRRLLNVIGMDQETT
jgi:hypothetical protein